MLYFIVEEFFLVALDTKDKPYSIVHKSLARYLNTQDAKTVSYVHNSKEYVGFIKFKGVFLSYNKDLSYSIIQIDIIMCTCTWIIKVLVHSAKTKR